MAKRVVVSMLALLLCLSVAVAVSAATPEQTASVNRQAAIRAATQLLSDVVPPVGATRTPTEPKGDDRQLAQPVERLFFAGQVDRHAFWITAASPGAVMASVKAHLPVGAKLVGSGLGGSTAFASYALPRIEPAALRERQLVINAAGLTNGSTAVRADGEVRYLAPRPADQQVPHNARVLDLTVTNESSKPLLSLTITRRSQIRRIAALVDSLPFGGNWSGVAFSCPGFAANSPVDTFIFRVTTGGPALARVSELAVTPPGADPCETTELTIRGRHEPVLMEGGVLLRKAGLLLGVKLTAAS